MPCLLRSSKKSHRKVCRRQWPGWLRELLGFARLGFRRRRHSRIGVGCWLRGRGWRARLEQAMAQRLASPQHDGQIALTFEVVYGHAFKPAPRVRVEANSTISLQDMRAMLRERT